MDQATVQVFSVVLAAAGAQVPLVVVVALQVPVHSLSYCEHADVKLPILVKKGPFAIFLNDIATFFAVNMSV